MMAVTAGTRPVLRTVARLALLAGAVIATPFLVVMALFIIGGSGTVHARATAPDGRLEARVETQGGSMQFPLTTLAIRPPAGWLGPVGDDCVIARWSDAETPVADHVSLDWSAPRRLTIRGVSGRLRLPARACGIGIEPR